MTNCKAWRFKANTPDKDDFVAYEETKGDVMQFWRAIVVGQKKRRGRIHTWGEQERALVSSEYNEVDFLLDNAEFIVAALEIEDVEVFRNYSGYL